MPSDLPERINFSIGYRCWVSCPGCYTFFGEKPPSLSNFVRSAAQFARLGISDITLSGGDPLLIDDLGPFLDQLRDHGVRSIKLDTVGISFLAPGSNHPSNELEGLLSRIDILGIPLDGWSNESASLFRRGRPTLFADTCLFLSALHDCRPRALVYVNTVLHQLNLAGLDNIYRVLSSYPCIDHWNIFQYTPTDQARNSANDAFEIINSTFESEKRRFLAQSCLDSSPFDIEFASTADRLGKYLLINSDGQVWMPDAEGRTIPLGLVFDHEEEILSAWSELAARLRSGPRFLRSTVLSGEHFGTWSSLYVPVMTGGRPTKSRMSLE